MGQSRKLTKKGKRERAGAEETPLSLALATYLCLIRAHKRKTLSIKDNVRRERQQQNKSKRDCLQEGGQ